ncbi:hypothetical protein M3Y99_00197700 [Aphelenchoides fujianensis]|nr:hypothetical protein M3Y99_00197700 [Aphelenchoides fujianensis]
MTEMMRDMIAQLMGSGRAEEEGRKLPPYDHYSVCRAYLLDCCPREILADTRLEGLAPCRKLHEKALRADFLARTGETRSRLRDRGKNSREYVRVWAFDALQEAIKTVDFEIERTKEKVKKDSDNLADSHDFIKAQRINDLNEKITSILAEMEKLGSEGKVNESVELSKTVSDLQRRKSELENNNRGGDLPGAQRLRVCDVCGAQLNILDHETRPGRPLRRQDAHRNGGDPREVRGDAEDDRRASGRPARGGRDFPQQRAQRPRSEPRTERSATIATRATPGTIATLAAAGADLARVPAVPNRVAIAVLRPNDAVTPALAAANAAVIEDPPTAGSCRPTTQHHFLYSLSLTTKHTPSSLIVVAK